MKKKEKGIHIYFSNRWLYTFILILVVLIAGGIVAALTPGVKPNPGHWINETAPPSPCAANQFLQFDGTNWKCADTPSSYCSGGTCSGGLTVTNNLVVNGGLITINNIQQFLGSGSCIKWSGISNSDWCLSASELPAPDFYTGGSPPANWNYVCCKYKIGGGQCIKNYHDKCNFYYLGSQILGANNPPTIPQS